MGLQWIKWVNSLDTRKFTAKDAKDAKETRIEELRRFIQERRVKQHYAPYQKTIFLLRALGALSG